MLWMGMTQMRMLSNLLLLHPSTPLASTPTPEHTPTPAATPTHAFGVVQEHSAKQVAKRATQLSQPNMTFDEFDTAVTVDEFDTMMKEVNELHCEKEQNALDGLYDTDEEPVQCGQPAAVAAARKPAVAGFRSFFRKEF
jgi:hypothetical protein